MDDLTPEALDTIEAEGYVIIREQIDAGPELWDGVVYKTRESADDELPTAVRNKRYSPWVVALVPVADLESQEVELRRLRTDNERTTVPAARYDRVTAERDALQAKIDAAPHTMGCKVDDRRPWDCTCWKSRAALTGEPTEDA